MRTVCSRGLSLAAVWLMFCPVLLLAHEGEDHDAKKQAGNSVSFSGQAAGLGSGGQGDRFEVVVTPDPAGGTVLFLADVVSNTPVSGAAIEFEASDGKSAWKGEAVATRQEGIYRSSWTPPIGTIPEMTLVVTIGKMTDLLLVRFDPPAIQEKPSIPSSPATWAWPNINGWPALLILGVVGWLVVRRGRKKRLAIGGLLLALASVPTFAWSHGGEEHGDSAEKSSPHGVTSGPGKTLALPKAVQFLLQVRTALAEPRAVADTLRLMGRVIPDPAGYARIQPSVPSRIGADPDISSPVAGQWVKQGESLAVLNPILSISERTEQRLSLMRAQRTSESTVGREMVLAPIDGQITDVHIVPGEVVTESTILAEIINPKRIRVEAILYDLAQARRIVAGVAKTRIYPDRLFRLRLVGVSPKVNAEHQGLHVQFAVEESFGELAIGMPVDVYAETGDTHYPVAIPRSAVTERGGIPMVWVKTAPESFAGRMVRTGRHTAEWVEILEGIAPGDKVVIQGQNQLAAIR